MCINVHLVLMFVSVLFFNSTFKNFKCNNSKNKSCGVTSAVKRLIASKIRVFVYIICVHCVYLLCIYKYTHMHVYIYENKLFLY